MRKIERKRDVKGASVPQMEQRTGQRGTKVWGTCGKYDVNTGFVCWHSVDGDRLLTLKATCSAVDIMS